MKRLRASGDAFWVVPALCVAGAIVAGIGIPILDSHAAAPGWLTLTKSAQTARSTLGTVVTLGVSVAGVSFSVIAVALVLASQQLSPRVLRSFQRQRLNQVVLGALLATATFALFAQARVGRGAEAQQAVPEISVLVALASAAVALVLFVAFLHDAVRSLNASVVIRRIAAEGHAAIAAPYPEGAGDPPRDPEAVARAVAERRSRAACLEVRAPRAGYVAEVDGAALVAWARAHDAFVDQRRPVGAFVVTGGLLALVHADDPSAVDVREASALFRIDEERVVEGDVAFPIRQLVDIALKGLSPGINDPTTAENAMDSVTDTLVRFASCEPVEPVRVDRGGVPRLCALAPTLGDLVMLGFDQVRRDGASRPSFSLRLLELLNDLRAAAPAAARCAEIDRQVELIISDAAARARTDDDRRLLFEASERLHPQVGVGGTGGALR